MAQNAELVLDALGNQMRRRILRILGDGPMTVGAIAAELPVSRPAVSRHLRLLEDAKLVRAEPQGRSTVVGLEQAGFDIARAWLDDFWGDALTRFKMVAENTDPQ